MFHGIIFNNSVTMSYNRTSGAYRVATFLRSHGWDIEIIDFAAYWTNEELQEVLKSRVNTNTKFIGFSILFSYWPVHMENLVEHIRIKYPDIITIMGGQNSQFVKSNVHYFINGYGENAVLKLFNYLFSNSTEEPIYKADWLEKNKKVIDHDQYPSAPLKSLYTEYQTRDFLEPFEWLTLELSRGCIFKCKYCNFPILGVKSDYSRDVVDYEKQLKDLYYTYGIKNYYIADETLNDSTLKLKKFSAVHDSLEFKTFYSAYVRPDLLVSKSRQDDKEFLLKMGVGGHFYGIESMNYESAKAIGKGMHPDILLPGLIEAKEYFKRNIPYRGHISMIVGLPYETKDTLTESVKWLIKNWQGESQEYLPLLIPKNTMYDKLNQFSTDFSNYGYRESKEIVQSVKLNSNIAHEFSAYNKFNWENDHFTFNSAIETCNKINKILSVYDFRNSTFTLGRFSYINLNLKDILDISLQESKKNSNIWLEKSNLKFNKFIQSYKMKKLNYNI